jgi:hypothetical protein
MVHLKARVPAPVVTGLAATLVPHVCVTLDSPWKRFKVYKSSDTSHLIQKVWTVFRNFASYTFRNYNSQFTLLSQNATTWIIWNILGLYQKLQITVILAHQRKMGQQLTCFPCCYCMRQIQSTWPSGANTNSTIKLGLASGANSYLGMITEFIRLH